MSSRRKNHFIREFHIRLISFESLDDIVDGRDWKFLKDGKFRGKKTMRPKVNVIVSIKNNCVTRVGSL